MCRGAADNFCLGVQNMLCIFSPRLKHETTAIGGYQLPQNSLDGFVKISQVWGRSACGWGSGPLDFLAVCAPGNEYIYDSLCWAVCALSSFCW